MPTQNTGGTVTKRITIKRMFNNCPKPDGWFGCFASVSHESDIRIMGTTTLPLKQGMVLDAELRPNRRDPSAWDVVSMTPVTKTMTGLISYLSSFDGINRTQAATLFRTLGDNASDVIIGDPGTAASKSGIDRDVINHLRVQMLAADQAGALRRFVPELSAKMVSRVIATFEKAGVSNYMEKIKADPYILADIPGVSFKTADAAALRMGINPLEPYRVNHGVVYLLQNGRGNGTYVNLSDPKIAKDFGAELGDLLNLTPFSQNELIQRAAALCGAAGPVVLRKSGNEYRMFLSDTDNGLTAIASLVNAARSMAPFVELDRTNGGYVPRVTPAELLDDINTAIRIYSKNASFPLTAEQRAAVVSALSNRVSIVTGGPGRGKTTTIDAIAFCFMWLVSRYGLVGYANIMLLAPTGKAMAKLDAATGHQYSAMTIDRLLATARFEASELNKLNDENCLFIIDESSMLDAEKAGNLLRHFKRAKFCFVGDIDQLPPIGKGRVLSDLIDSGRVPVSRLTQPQRQGEGSVVLTNADKIKSGDIDIQWDFKAMPFFPQDSDEALLQTTVDQYLDELQTISDPSELALLCPIRNGPAGVIALNMAIQDITCPEKPGQIQLNIRKNANIVSQKGHPIPGTFYGTSTKWTRFRVGDSVVCTKNNYGVETVKFTDDDYWNGTYVDRTVGIFNGECGRIIAYMPGKSVGRNASGAIARRDVVVVQLFNNRIAELDMTLGEFDDFDLAYAMTVHKAQGCEYDTVLYVSPGSLTRMTASGFANRSLVYTGATRARHRVVIIGSKASVHGCIQTGLPDCCSDLVQRILTGSGGDLAVVQGSRIVIRPA